MFFSFRPPRRFHMERFLPAIVFSLLVSPVTSQDVLANESNSSKYEENAFYQHCSKRRFSNMYECGCVADNEAMLRQYASDNAKVYDENSSLVRGYRGKIESWEDALSKTDNEKKIAALERNIAAAEAQIVKVKTRPEPSSFEYKQLYAYFNSASLCRSAKKSYDLAVEGCHSTNRHEDDSQVAAYCQCVGDKASDGWVNPTPQKRSWSVILLHANIACNDLKPT